MRRDVFINNDSGGFSVVAADSVDAIIEDARSDDERFVTAHKAMLVELYGDDAMPVRVVVDEPLQRDEEAQWLAKASARGRLFERHVNARVPGTFPLGLPSALGDPDIDWFRDRLTGRERAEAPALIATTVREIIEAWFDAAIESYVFEGLSGKLIQYLNYSRI